MDKVKNYGQVFTPKSTVNKMLSLRKNAGKVLEPSAGDGAFFKRIPGCVGIEIDKDVCLNGCLNIDFFDYDTVNKYNSIIGNPPFVSYQNIPKDTANKLTKFDNRTNLYVYFIDKCIDHLVENGEIIFITPREFLKATSSIKLNEKIYATGTITDIYDLGDQAIFKGYSPNCIIWRFEKDNFSRKTNFDGTEKNFVYMNGMLLFLSGNYNKPFSDYFFVKVGAVSGLDEVYTNENGNMEFVYSKTRDNGQVRRMYWGNVPELIPFKDKLLARKIKKFDENNWWDWGRKHHYSDEKRVYVNCKTRRKNPFFCHPCKNYDGAVLACFLKHGDEQKMSDKLNSVNWEELGFICDGRYIFSQRSLESIMLPEDF